MQVRRCVKSILFSLVLALAESRIVIEDVQESEIIILLNKHGHKESVAQQIYVDNGENFTLTCATVHSYADDVVNLRWFKTNKVVLREGEYLVKEEPMESSNPLTLNFSPVDISDAGSYMCKHLHSNIHRSVYIKVNTPHSGDHSVNIVITKIREDGVEENVPEKLEVWEGNRFTLRCKANSNLPALSKLNLISSSEIGEDVFKESFIKDNELKFDPVRLTDTGIYSCSDNHGNESKTVHITVKPHHEQGFPQNHDHAEEEKKKKHAQPETGSFLASRFGAVEDLEDTNKHIDFKLAEQQKPNNRITFNGENEKPKNQKNLENEDNNKHLNEQVDILPEKNLHGKNKQHDDSENFFEKQSQKGIFEKPHDEIKDKRNEFFNKEFDPRKLMEGVMTKFYKFKPGDLEGEGKDKHDDGRSDIQRHKVYETEDKMVEHDGSRKDDREEPSFNIFEKNERKNEPLNKFEEPAHLNIGTFTVGHDGSRKDDREEPSFNIFEKNERKNEPLNKFEELAHLNIDANNKQHMFDNVKPYVADSVQKFLDTFENFKKNNDLAALANRRNFPKQYNENDWENSEKMNHLENRFGNEKIPSEDFFAEDENDNIQKPFSERRHAGDADERNGVDHHIKNQLNDLEEEFKDLDDVVEIEDLVSKILTAFDRELSDVTEISKIPEWINVNADKNLIKKEINHLLQEFKQLKDMVKFEKFLATILRELEKGSDYDWILFAHDKQEALNELLDNFKSERFNGKNKNMVSLSEKFDVPKGEEQGWHLADRFNDSPQGDIFDDADEFMQADQGISENQIPKSQEEVHDTSNREQESKKSLTMDIMDLHKKLRELEDLKEIENVQKKILEKLDDYGSTENKQGNGQNFGEFPNRIPFKPNSHNDVAESKDEFNDGSFFDNPTGRKLKVYSEFLKDLRDCLEEELSNPKDAGVNEKELPSDEWDNERGEKEHSANENLDEEVENIPIVIRPRLGDSEDFDFGNDYGRWHQDEVNVRDWKENSQTLPGNSHTRMPSYFKEDQIWFDDDSEKGDDDDVDDPYYDSVEGSGTDDTSYDFIKHDIEKAVSYSEDDIEQERYTSTKENPVENLNDTSHSTLIISGLSIAIAILSFVVILRTWCLSEFKKQKSGANVDDESKYTLLP